MQYPQQPQQNQQIAEAKNFAQPAKLRLRLLAITYDSLIILFISTLSVVLIQLLLVGDRHIPAEHILNKILKPFWFVPGFLYLGYYWTRFGQTPSMKIWKIKLVNRQGLLISWSQALRRYVFALLGLGLIWALFNKRRLTLQDVLSHTSLIKIDR